MIHRFREVRAVVSSTVVSTAFVFSAVVSYSQLNSYFMLGLAISEEASIVYDGHFYEIYEFHVLKSFVIVICMLLELIKELLCII